MGDGGGGGGDGDRDSERGSDHRGEISMTGGRESAAPGIEEERG